MPLFEDLTPEEIQQRVLSRMDTELETREGSWAYDQAAPMSVELWRWAMTLNELVAAFYVNETSGPYLDEHARLFALRRREGARAQTCVEFFGRDGTSIPYGTAFFTEDGREYRLLRTHVDRDIEIEDGRASGKIEAVEVGGRYNAAPGEISRILRNIPGLERFEADWATGGADPETDADLFARLDEKRKRPPTSGNEAHYREWALSVDGVGVARVTRCWAGPGTVLVLIAGYDRHPVDGAVVDACAAYIETRRPVGAKVTVASAKAVAVDVAAGVVLEPTASREVVKTAFEALLNEYFAQAAFLKYTVYASRVAALLMSVEGVVDYTGLTLNGTPENLELEGDSVPVVGEVFLA